MTNAILTFLLTLGDSLCGCLQVLNLVHRRRVAAFVVSLCMGACKISAVILVVKSTTPAAVVAYLLGGAIGAQISLCFPQRLRATTGLNAGK